jgi:hypothetical protein
VGTCPPCSRYLMNYIPPKSSLPSERRVATANVFVEDNGHCTSYAHYSFCVASLLTENRSYERDRHNGLDITMSLHNSVAVSMSRGVISYINGPTASSETVMNPFSNSNHLHLHLALHLYGHSTPLPTLQTPAPKQVSHPPVRLLTTINNHVYQNKH